MIKSLTGELLAKLELEALHLILRERRLRWFGHVERSSGTVRTACDIKIEVQADMEETGVSGSSQQLTLKKGARRDQV